METKAAGAPPLEHSWPQADLDRNLHWLKTVTEARLPNHFWIINSSPLTHMTNSSHTQQHHGRKQEVPASETGQESQGCPKPLTHSSSSSSTSRTQRCMEETVNWHGLLRFNRKPKIAAEHTVHLGKAQDDMGTGHPQRHLVLSYVRARGLLK